MTSPLHDEEAAEVAALFAALDEAVGRIMAERDAAIAAARAALTMRDETLAVVARDLRGPLHIIEACAHQLQRSVTDPVLRRYVEQIARGVRHASRLVRDLVEAAAGAAGVAIAAAPTDVVQVVLTAIETQQLLAATGGVVLEPAIAADIPAALADEPRLQTVLENLIGNAVKFSPGGGVITVGVAAEPDGAAVRVWVRDRGVGIPAEHLPHVFERFWQGAKRDRRGAGLGLAICRAVVDAHGGSIRCDSAPGHGTTVTFTIPAAR